MLGSSTLKVKARTLHALSTHAHSSPSGRPAHATASLSAATCQQHARRRPEAQQSTMLLFNIQDALPELGLCCRRQRICVKDAIRTHRRRCRHLGNLVHAPCSTGPSWRCQERLWQTGGRRWRKEEKVVVEKEKGGSKPSDSWLFSSLSHRQASDEDTEAHAWQDTAGMASTNAQPAARVR